MLKFLRNIGQLILSPGNGWEDVSYSGDDPKVIASTGLYPLIGLAAATTFLRYFFEPNMELVQLLQQAIIVFVQLFVTYFIASAVFGITLFRWVEGEPNEKRYNTVIAYSLAIMALIITLENCLPIKLTLTYFLYIYVALVIWKSSRYLAVKTKRVGYFMITAILSIIVLPFLVGALLSSII